jgi:serine/threonine protein kinase
LAFKAASLVIAKIKTDVSKLVGIQSPLPEIPLESRKLPNVTKIGSVDFTILSRHDEQVEYRYLYHARITSTGEEIYVKFTQQYSRELHEFCAGKGLAPKLLGFDRLPGGWFALAMEKIDTVDLAHVESSRLDVCKQEIRDLVRDFHAKGLVHGDLRPPNFIFTKGSPTRMLLVDFDWGGKEKEVFFPCGQLADGLRGMDNDRHDRLDQPIKKEDDERVLEMTFKRMDKPAPRASRT